MYGFRWHPRSVLSSFSPDHETFSFLLASFKGHLQLTPRFAGTLLGVATGNLAKEFHVDIFQAETLQSYQFLSCGIAAAISCIVARIFGKRPVYLLSVGIEFFSAIWNATGTSFTSVFWSRIFYGIGIGAFEAMVLSTIGDMYFVRLIPQILRCCMVCGPIAYHRA